MGSTGQGVFALEINMRQASSVAYLVLGLGIGLFCMVGLGVVALIIIGASQRKLAPTGDMSLKGFVLQKPSKPTTVLATVSLSTYYGCAYRQCAETHYSFRIKDGNESDHVYAPKTSKHGKRLYQLLKNGSEQQMMIRLQRIGPEGDSLPERDDDYFALIDAVE